MLKAALGVALWSGALVACGDDLPGRPDADAGDAATDASPDASVADARPEDASTPDAELPSPLVECDPFVMETCPAGEKCSVVRALDDVEREVIEVRFACTASGRDADEGATCTRTVDATPTLSLDRLLTDNCAHGLACLDTEGLTFPTCQRLCRDREVDCGDAAFCMPYRAEPRFGVCVPVDDCDPVYQRYCPFSFTCYPVVDTSGDLRSICLRYRPDMVGEDERCELLTHCAPSTTCVASEPTDAGVPVGRCRRLCDYHAAFIPEMLGEGPGGCPLVTDSCVAIELDPGRESRLPIEPGICR